MDIIILRNLITRGEYLEQNYKDDSIRTEWIYQVENFLEANNFTNVKSDIHRLKFFGSDPFGKTNFNNIMGFLRFKYNSSSERDNLVITSEKNQSSNNSKLLNNSQQVFIVHGHDDELISEVKECIINIGLTPIVLREQPNQGLTIIEKLEQYRGNCKCAVILYTPCDKGNSVNNLDILEERARQNVVFEHGLFQGFLGRKRVIVLKKSSTTIPGDCDGIVWHHVDSKNWKNNLQTEILGIDNHQ